MDQRIVAHGGVSTDSGEVGLFAGTWCDQARIEGSGLREAVEAPSCIQGPELQAGFRADVGRLDVGTHLCSPMGAGRLVGETGGEAVGGEDGGGEDGGGHAGGGDAGAAMTAAGSRADVGRPGPGWRAGVGYRAWVQYTYG